jgi:hypothetical protein
VSDLAGHQELQRVDRAGVVRVIDQALIHDLGACFSGDVAAKIHIELASDLGIICRSGVPHRIKQNYATAAGDRNQGIGFSRFAIRL